MGILKKIMIILDMNPGLIKSNPGLTWYFCKNFYQWQLDSSLPLACLLSAFSLPLACGVSASSLPFVCLLAASSL